MRLVISGDFFVVSEEDRRAIAFAPHGPYDPYAFAPERFLVPDGDDLPPDPAVWAFGFARR